MRYGTSAVLFLVVWGVMSVLLEYPFDSCLCCLFIGSIEEEYQCSGACSYVLEHLIITFNIDMVIVAFKEDIAIKTIGCFDEK